MDVTKKLTNIKVGDFSEWRKTEPYVGEDAIYVPKHEYMYEGTITEYYQFMTKELFQEAFKEYIVKEGLLDVQDKKQRKRRNNSSS